jgi:two-component system, cell cycle sensor histidine kinase and response regulator CckA
MSRISLILTIILLFPSVLSADPGATQPRNLLILHSYHQGLGWTDGISRGIEAHLARASVKAELFYEYLDTKRIDDEAHQANLLQLLRHKYGKRRFDAIIVSDDFAFSLLLEHHQELFPETPVVFCGVNYFEEKMLGANPWITGVVETFSLKDTIDAALHIEPRLQRMVVIDDDTITAAANRKLLQNLMPRYQERLQFEFFDGLTMNQLQQRCAQLPDNSAVLLLSFTRDQAGAVFSLERSAELLSPHCRVPVYSVWDFHLHRGILGGMLITGEAQGEKAAELMLRVLAGVAPSAIPVVKEGSNRLLFDYRTMQRFAITPQRLPPGSTIVNQPPSFYEQHRALVLQAALAFLLLLSVIVVISVNLVRRRTMEKALKRSEQRLRAIFAAAESVAFIITDSSVPLPKIIDFSPGAERMFGYRREEILGHPVSRLHLPEDVARFSARRRTMMETRKGLSEETTLVRKGGQCFSALFSVHPLLDERGEMWAALGVSIDISEQKRTEAALRESTARFRELSEMLPEAIFEIDFAGRVLFLNKSGMEQFGFTAEELSAGINAYDFFPGEEKEKLKNNLSRLMRGEQMGLNEYLVQDKGGKLLPVMTRSALILKDEQPVGLRGFLIDISERKRLEENLHKAQRLEAIGTLAGGIAHDFNNILMGIEGRASLSLLALPLDNPLREHLSCIEDYVRSAASLTAQLLGFARAGTYNMVATDINELVGKTASMFGRTKKELSLHLHLQEGLPAARVDQNQIEQVLLNLLVNAWQAMPDGGRVDLVTTCTELDDSEAKILTLEPGQYLTITVTDSGIGIDEEIRHRIFEPFFTTKERGRGTGLGLASAYGIVRNHHGTITVKSRKGEGAQFTIFLPATAELPRRTSSAESDVLRGKESILLVDDEPMILEVATAMLGHLGYQVTSAVGGTEALAWYHTSVRFNNRIILTAYNFERIGFCNLHL